MARTAATFGTPFTETAVVGLHYVPLRSLESPALLALAVPLDYALLAGLAEAGCFRGLLRCRTSLGSVGASTRDSDIAQFQQVVLLAASCLAVDSTPGLLAACRRLWSSAMEGTKTAAAAAELLLLLTQLKPQLTGTLLDFGIRDLAAADTSHALMCKASLGHIEDQALFTASALLLEKLERCRAQREEQQASSAPQGHQLGQRGAGGGMLGSGKRGAAVGNTVALHTQGVQAVGRLTLARMAHEAELWPEALLKDYLGAHQLASPERLDQCRTKEDLLALCQEIGGPNLLADSRATGAAQAAVAAGSQADVAAAAGQTAEPPFPAVLPRDQAALRCAACGVSREQAKLKECTGRFFYCSKACQVEAWPGHRRFCKLSLRFAGWNEGKARDKILLMSPDERQEFLPLLWAVQPELARIVVQCFH
ncbi:hypothetical protein N2152v2_000218 [Parachlorella kessleri]